MKAIQRFVELYEQKINKTKNLRDEACNYLPGGVAGNAGLLMNKALYLENACGGVITDVDGNEYIDLILCGTAAILGHSPPEIVEPVREQLSRGTAYMLFHETGIEVAKKMQKHVPHLERIRFANSGTEATMFAIRTARAYTGKDKIAKPEGGYHGQHDSVLVSFAKSAGSDKKPDSIADSAGIPTAVPKNTIAFPWNDIEATVEIIEANAEDLAAVILEPVQGFGIGAIPADREYLAAVREVTQKHDILLIFDEVITGFRVGGMGGAAGYYQVIPDLACYGKSVAGGFPVGAYGGRADVMDQTVGPEAAPEKKVFQSGTFTGNAVSMTAALACLSELEKKDYGYIDNLAAKLKEGVVKIATDKGFPIQFTGLGSFYYPHFNPNPIKNVRDRKKDDAELNTAFCMGLIANGVYLTPAHAGAICFAHTEADIDFILEVSEKVLDQIKE